MYPAMGALTLVSTPETVYKVYHLSPRKHTFRQIYLITDQKLLYKDMSGLRNSYFLSDFTLYPVTYHRSLVHPTPHPPK